MAGYVSAISLHSGTMIPTFSLPSQGTCFFSKSSETSVNSQTKMDLVHNKGVSQIPWEALN
jgi:hypothetical protein